MNENGEVSKELDDNKMGGEAAKMSTFMQPCEV
jgi:hypothetical protein